MTDWYPEYVPDHFQNLIYSSHVDNQQSFQIPRKSTLKYFYLFCKQTKRQTENIGQKHYARQLNGLSPTKPTRPNTYMLKLRPYIATYVAETRIKHTQHQNNVRPIVNNMSAKILFPVVIQKANKFMYQ